jgi:tetratricopeptide (TPR) repeat protein
MNFLLWLPFISDDRELGIRMLRTSVQKGNFNKFAAYSALIAILIDAERYEEARILASEALQFYPNNRVFLWGLSSTLRRWGRKEEAIVAYTALLNAILSDSHPNLFNELACRSDILHLKIALKDFEGIEEQINKILSFENKYFLPHLQQRALKHFRAARELKSYTLKKN